MIDDYALLPPEIQATIRAASEGDWGRIIAVFQPFRYARTAIMWREFADAFVGADQVILTDVCGFHEQPIPGVTGHLIVNAVLDAHPELPVAYFPHRAELVKLIPGYAREGDLVLTLGGGDITDARRRPARRGARAGRGSDRDRAHAVTSPTSSRPRSSRRCPGGSSATRRWPGLTTYRVGGPADVLVRARREGDLAVVAAALRSPPAAAADPRPGLEPARRRRRLSRARARCSRASSRRSPPGEGTVQRRRRRRRSRCSPAGPRRPGSAASSSTSASRGRSAARCG